MDAATAGQNDGAFVFHQAFRAVLGVAEGDAGTGNQVKIILQLSWDVEVVHRRGDNDSIVGLQLGNQFV
ncbi:hypothetical protein D3C78_1771480 [compost metagenome]